MSDQPKARQAEYSADLDWYLNESASASGERGTTCSTVNSLERGGPSGGVPSTDPYTDKQVGFSEDSQGNRRSVEGDFSRRRRCDAIWGALPCTGRNVLQPRAVLLAHYTFTLRTGKARDNPRSGEDLKEEKGYGKPDIREVDHWNEWERLPANIEATLGDLARVAVFLALRTGTLPKLIESCEKDKKTRVERYRRAAKKAVKLAHTPWFAHPQSKRPAVREFARQFETSKPVYLAATETLAQLLRRRYPLRVGGR